MGKHKIEIEKIEEKHRRHIAFSKRRKGLFKKAASLCALGCEVAAIVISSSENTFTFAQPDLDRVVDRFLDEGRDQQLPVIPFEQVVAQEGLVEEEEEETAGDQLEDDQTKAMSMSSAEEDDDEELEEEESKMELEDRRNGGGRAAAAGQAEELEWWNQPVEGLGREELMETERSLQELRDMAMERWKELFLKAPLLSLYPTWDPRSESAGGTTTAAAAAKSTSTRPLPPLDSPPPEGLDLELRL